MKSWHRLFRKKKWPALLLDVLSVWGLAGAIVTITGFFDKLQGVNDALKGSWIPLVALLAISVGWAIIKNWPKTRFEFPMAGRDSAVQLVVGDALSEPGLWVVPINHEFDAHLGGSVAKSGSIKAQVIERFFDNNPALLQAKLDTALSNEIYTEARTGKVFPIGTTATIEHAGHRFHFVVNSIKTNDKRVEARGEDLIPALAGLWTYLADHGPKGDVVVPLLGTGNGRLNIPREEVFKDLVRSFIASCSAKSYCEKLTIAITQDDVDRHNIDIEALEEFLSFECRFARFQSGPRSPVGTPVR
jgi:hypothetical protein